MNYYAKRILQTLVVLFFAITLSFVLYRMLPLGPVEIMKARFMDQIGTGTQQSISQDQLERINRLVEAYTNINPEQPLWEAYLNYMSDIVIRQDFGKSIYRQEPVFDLLFARMPWSIFISVYGLALGTTTSLLFGATMAHYEGGWFDKGLTLVTIGNLSVPYYIVGIAALVVFAYQLQIFPTGGRMDPNTVQGFNVPFVVSIVEHAALPVLSLFIAGFGGALAYRGNCIRELGEGYIRVARLRGISESRLALRYVGRNALLPIYTGIMMGIAGLFSSGIIVEQIFSYPAIGWLTFQALLNRDYPLIMGAFIFFTVITLAGILIADLTYGVIDPRVKSGGERESY